MIDKVRFDNSYRSSSVTPPKKLPADADLLLRDPGKNGVVYEPSAKKQEVKLPEKDSVSISIYEKTAENTAEGKKEEGENPSPLLTGLKKGFSRVLQAVKSFFHSLWNGPDKTAESPPNEAVTKESAPEIIAAEKEASPGSADFLNQIIKSHDTERLMQYLTENGQKKPARSTDLLTSYDNHGRIVSVSPSDRKRILEGDFSDIRL